MFDPEHPETNLVWRNGDIVDLDKEEEEIVGINKEEEDIKDENTTLV